ncbi:Caveolin-1, variant 3 [Dermatophagoides farinae]|uniref:Caveolin-1, variant 2 n=1 Tax=Dermatophagoides farinae TaxID=6954 RepID=A0A922LC47_DERFA|nr:Caveolin-1, variant 2 [Dermatophagoides farinae]KAH9522866.1 Caveolin-1, variant 3 [Dermatophagoides farinae]
MENKTGSKSNLNESVLPLLDDEIHKEKIELKENSTPKSNETDDLDEKTNAGDNAKDAADAAKKKKEEEKERKRQKKLEEEERKKQLKLEKQKQKEEEKEKKKQQKAEKKATMDVAKGTSSNGTCSNGISSGGILTNRLNQFTVGINLLDRDERSINDHINVSFEDVIGEPDATQGFDAAYQLSFGLFQFVRFWLYRILMAIISLPLAFIWALVFALLSLISVWIITPGFRVMDILFFFMHRVWACLVRTFLDPIFTSIALVRQSDPKSYHPLPIITNSGRPLSTVYKDGIKYNKVNSNETVETYKTSNNGEDQLSQEEQVTVMIG